MTWARIIPSYILRQHPAKFAPGLIRRIYRHAIEQGYLSPGDRVVDPFAGIACGAFDALRHGLFWTGVELEPSFVTLGRQNILRWNREAEGRSLRQWGDARLIEGDSRQLVELIAADDALFAACISSPPYTSKGLGHGGRSRALDALTDAKKLHPVLYGLTPGQLGNMPLGRADAVVSSPPWQATLARDAIDQGARKAYALEHGIANTEHVSPVDMERKGARDQSYGRTTGQIGNQRGETFWTASQAIMTQVFQTIRPGGVAIWVCKSFVRKGHIVPFPDQWEALAQQAGFIPLERIRAWLVRDRANAVTLLDTGDTSAVTTNLIGETTEKTGATLVAGRRVYREGSQILPPLAKRASFFKRSNESKGAPPVDYEDVLILLRPV